MMMYLWSLNSGSCYVYMFYHICRLQRLKEAFHGKYEESPLFYACAPGRVNLIGRLLFIRIRKLYSSRRKLLT